MRTVLAIAAIGVAVDAVPSQGQDGAHMKAVRIHQFGAPTELRIEQVSVPAPGPGELLIRVHAAGVNPVDAFARAGMVQDLVAARLPYVPGFDVSGTVAARGSGVTAFDAGEGVYAMIDLKRGGGYAEYAIVRVDEAAARPRGLSHSEAASLPLVALTAWQALIDEADLQPGQTVLVHAGAGGVGSIAVQLARWRGARVIATASKSNHDFLRSIGADVVIDYRTQRFEDIAKDVDVVLDPLGGETQDRSLQVLADGGIIVGLSGITRRVREAGVRHVPLLVDPSGVQLERIAALVNAGSIRPIVSHRFALDEVAAAHRQIESRHTRGKIVLELR